MPAVLTLLLFLFAAPLLILLLLDSLFRAWFVLHGALPPLAPDEPSPTPGAKALAVVIPAHDEEAMRWFLKAASEAPGGAVSYLFRIPRVYIAGNCTGTWSQLPAGLGWGRESRWTLSDKACTIVGR